MAKRDLIPYVAVIVTVISYSFGGLRYDPRDILAFSPIDVKSTCDRNKICTSRPSSSKVTHAHAKRRDLMKHSKKET